MDGYWAMIQTGIKPVLMFNVQMFNFYDKIPQ